MDPVSKLGRALAVLRGATHRRQGKVVARGADKTPSGGDSAELREVVARRLRSLGNGPGARDASVRLVLEQLLVREFGESVLSTPRFQDTLRDVQRIMEADAQCRADLEGLIAELAKSHD